MFEERDYIIQISKLNRGENRFEYKINKELFDYFDSQDVQDVDCNLNVLAKKSENMIEIEFSFKGQISVLCGRCLNNMNILIDKQDVLYVKFGDKYEEVDINEIIIPEKENDINLIQYIYDDLLLEVPISPKHENEEDCDKEMLEKISLMKEQQKKDEDEIDPRWEKLKELKNK
jgi:uncharacterized metal-binding protein YceD (DUF177 family)